MQGFILQAAHRAKLAIAAPSETGLTAYDQAVVPNLLWSDQVVQVYMTLHLQQIVSHEIQLHL